MDAVQNQPAFTFAHLSDPHLTSLHAVTWPQLASKRLLGYLSWVRKRRAEHRSEILQALATDLKHHHYDHVVVTGDLTHIALPDEFVEARNWLESLGAPADVSIVPGNHDAYVRGAAQKGLSEWSPFMCSDEEAPGAGFPTLRVRGPVAFIGLSSAVPSPPLFATGRVGQPQLERFGELLRWAGQRGLCRVVLIHHPPVPGLEKWRKRLTDAVAVSEIIDEHGAELVLHGHCHRPLESQLTYSGRRHVPVLGVPSASSIHQNPERVAQYYLYRVTKAPAAWRLDVTAHGYVHGDGVFRQRREMVLEIPREA